MLDLPSMNGAEFVRRAKRYARKSGLPCHFDPSLGKGGHGRLHLGGRITAAPTSAKWEKALRAVGRRGCEIYDVHTGIKWPRLTAVVVSVLHVAKDHFLGEKRLDGKAVEKITAFLFHRGGNNDPARLKANESKSFVGSYV